MYTPPIAVIAVFLYLVVGVLLSYWYCQEHNYQYRQNRFGFCRDLGILTFCWIYFLAIIIKEALKEKLKRRDKK